MPAHPRALIFDVFGTLVDWRSGVAREVKAHLPTLVPDPDTFVDEWRGEYQGAMEAVRRGEIPFCTLDVLHRRNLDRVLAARGLQAEVDEPTRHSLNLAWHRLDAWPEVPAALQRLRGQRLLAPCSNGHIALMVALARHNGLVWDAVLGAELARDYKPKPAVYLQAVAALALPPSQVMMVAAHSSDLAAAAACGLRTAFVARPDEHGPGRGEHRATVAVDLAVADLAELAAKLGC